MRPMFLGRTAVLLCKPFSVSALPSSHVRDVAQQALAQPAQLACLGLALAALAAPLDAQAYNVRIEDVESPSLQAVRWK
jgi:hypothetical protein